ncbi:MAG TPA: hypothetical protein VKP04_04430 [Ktedonobacteraceae bacterium]|nr:hypothetical protein [Ktedonobacteraceae bacterium]
MRQNQDASTFERVSISWWSWRPGIKPRTAFVIGGLSSLVALMLASIGLLTVISGVADNLSQPLLVHGMVTKHVSNSLDGQLRLQIRLHTTGFPAEILPVVTNSAFRDIHDSETILLNYSPNLHILYALQSKGHHYTLPVSGAAGLFFGAIVLLLFSIVLSLYPLALAYWGWCDLHGHNGNSSLCEMTAEVVGLRAAVQTRPGRPGLYPRPFRTWFGVALRPVGKTGEGQVMTFAISEEAHNSLRKGEILHITYSPHLHYIYSMESAE